MPGTCRFLEDPTVCRGVVTWRFYYGCEKVVVFLGPRQYSCPSRYSNLCEWVIHDTAFLVQTNPRCVLHLSSLQGRVNPLPPAASCFETCCSFILLRRFFRCPLFRGYTRTRVSSELRYLVFRVLMGLRPVDAKLSRAAAVEIIAWCIFRQGLRRTEWARNGKK